MSSVEPNDRLVGFFRRICSRKQLLRIARIAIGFVIIVALLELSSRVLHGWAAPLLPYYYVDGAPHLPPNQSIKVRFASEPIHHFITDQGSARIGDRTLVATPMRDGVLVLGDSQVLGYANDFDDTFASLVAQSLTGDRNNARILASPAMDVEKMANALANYELASSEQTLVVIGVNLGNDLDEMFFEGPRRGETTSSSYRYLTCNSFAFMDVMMLKQSWELSSSHAPPGVNRIVFGLDPSERVVLARQLVLSVERLVALVPPAKRIVIFLIPSDYQVSISEYDKYRKYFDSENEFHFWQREIPNSAEQMNAVQRYIESRLRNLGLEVLSLQDVIGVSGDSADFFTDTSHHLTSQAHAAIATVLVSSHVREHRERPQ